MTKWEYLTAPILTPNTPNLRIQVKLVVKDPRLRSPTERQMSPTGRSVVRSSAAARSSRRVSRYACGDSPNAERNARLKCARDRPAALAMSSMPSPFSSLASSSAGSSRSIFASGSARCRLWIQW